MGKKIGYFASVDFAQRRHDEADEYSGQHAREERVEDRKVGQCTRVPTCEPADRCLEYRGTSIVVHDPHRGDLHFPRCIISQLFISYNSIVFYLTSN